MPVFNEVGTIDQILAILRAIAIDAEIIVVDDGSTDGTRDRLRELAQSDARLRVHLQTPNRGKGAALRAGFAVAAGRFVIVQDADLEYDPNDFHRLLAPLLADEADVVYGSRFAKIETGVRPFTWHRFGNQTLTRFSNACTGMKLTDMETCYKVFRREIIQSISFQENRFGFEPEVTAKIARLRIDGRPLRVSEVPIYYRGRSNREGKKIGWKDGFRALWCIVKYNLFLPAIDLDRA